MNKKFKIGLISFSILLGVILLIVLIVRLTTKDSKTCNASSSIPNGTIGDCTSTLVNGATCYPICNSGYTLSGNRTCNNGSVSTASCNLNTLSSGCTTTCGTDMYCKGNTCVTNANYPAITSQPDNTIQLVNNTSDNYLHIFIQCTTVDEIFAKSSGEGLIYPPVDWSTNNGIHAWSPIGALIYAEIIIPKNKFIILTLPTRDHLLFILQPIKMQNPYNNTPLKLFDKINSIIITGQSPLLLEAQKDGVADISGVNGINFKVKYELTIKDGKYGNTEIQKNPCERISDVFKTPNAGCWSPVKKICDASSTCECYPDTQNCKFNDCTSKLFTIPENLSYLLDNYDGGGGTCPNHDDFVNHPDIVKKFINNNKHLKQNSEQAKYCDDIQFNSGDYTTYCYDYNDINSSPYWTAPYKAKLVYSDL